MERPRPGSGIPFVVAHTGCLGTPANSLASVEAARGAGAQAIEFDVQATADGYPVLVHDPFLLLGGGRGRVDLRDIADRAALRRYEGAATIPTLEEAVTACAAAELYLNLDIKDSAALPAVESVLDALGYTDRTFLTGCSLKTVRRNQSGRYRGSGELAAFVNLGDAELDRRGAVLPHIIDDVCATGSVGINVEYTNLQCDTVRRAHAAGLLVATWTVDSSEAIETVRHTGSDYITTNYPDRVLKVYDRVLEGP